MRAPSLFPQLPPGFHYEPEFISSSEEAGLLARVGALDFGEVRMHGVVARRRVRQYGWHYRFDTYTLTQGPAVPDFLLPLQARGAALAGIDPEDLSEALVTEYPPGATIGWHRDAPIFGVVVGISLGSACPFKLRPVPVADDAPSSRPRRVKPVVVTLEPRSAYVMDGEARRAWQHSIPAVKALRYSITFRTLRRQPGDQS